MQNQDIKDEFILLAVPKELLCAVQIFAGDPVQMHVENKKLIIENLDDLSGFVCNGDCKDCFIHETDCDGECSACPCAGSCENTEVE